MGEAGIYFEFEPAESFTSGAAAHDVEKLINAQRNLMHACGVFDLPPDIALWVTVSALQMEAGELIAFFGDLTKPWKAQKAVHLPAVKEEAIDVLHFLLQVFILLGMDADEVVDTYMRKNRVNFSRIQAKLGETNV